MICLKTGSAPGSLDRHRSACRSIGGGADLGCQHLKVETEIRRCSSCISHMILLVKLFKMLVDDVDA